MEQRERIAAIVAERVGQLKSFATLAPGSNLRDALGAIERFMSALEAADIDSCVDKDQRKLAQVGGVLDANPERLQRVVEAGRRFFTQTNLQQLAHFLSLRSDSQSFKLSLRDPPWLGLRRTRS